MIIEIPDDISPQERYRLLEYLPVAYALSLFETRKDAAKFLCVSIKTLQNRIYKYPELKKYMPRGHYKPRVKSDDELSPEELRRKNFLEMKRRYPDE